MQFQKKFSIGLPVLDSVDVFNKFLDDYCEYIENIYFSLPLGDRFHSREVTKKVLSDPRKTDYFIELLKCVKRHGICLEVLFNTPNLTEQDITEGKRFLELHELEPDEVGFIDDYYDIIRKLLPRKRYVYSFNNFPQCENDYLSNPHKYEQYVIGRKFIRNAGLFKKIKEKDAKVVLLLNNGCSFTCGGCRDKHHCHDSYYKELHIYSPEYLYAKQSIFPFEINEGLLDISNVDYFKVASRNANVKYIIDCLESYINNYGEDIVRNDSNNYLLWARLSWHYDYFKEFDYNRIVEIKKAIYGNKNYSYHNAKRVNIGLDLSDWFSIKNYRISLQIIDENLKEFCAGYRIRYDACDIECVYLGVQSCGSLLSKIDVGVLAENILFLIGKGVECSLVIPAITNEYELNLLDNILEGLKEKGTIPNSFVVNDEVVYKNIKAKFDKPVGLGRDFDYLSASSCLSLGSGESVRQDVFNNNSFNYIKRNNIFVISNLPVNGIWLPKNNSIDFRVDLSVRKDYRKHFCEKKMSGGCDLSCINKQNKEVYIGNYRSVPVSATNDIISSLLEQRCKFIYSPAQPIERC